LLANSVLEGIPSRFVGERYGAPLTEVGFICNLLPTHGVGKVEQELVVVATVGFGTGIRL
jgi:hypothetical protein